MSPDAHDQLVRSTANRFADIKDRRGETRKMITNLDAVEPDGGTELGFIDAENCDTFQFGDFKRTSVPEPVTSLLRHASVVDVSVLGKVALADSLLDQHPAVEFIHIRKRRLG